MLSGRGVVYSSSGLTLDSEMAAQGPSVLCKCRPAQQQLISDAAGSTSYAIVSLGIGLSLAAHLLMWRKT